jgi:alkylhydroperoxidase family enzyme
VAKVLADHTTAPVSDQVRATLGLLKKVTESTRTGVAVTADDMRAVLATGVTRDQIEDALHVAFCFNVITRLADTFAFWIGPPSAFATSAKMLLTRGYNL